MNSEFQNSCESGERRKVLKTIVGTVSAVAAYNLLPTKWGTPLVESVFLPAHAATSGGNSNTQNSDIVGRWSFKDSDNTSDTWIFESNGTWRGSGDDRGTYSIRNRTVDIYNNKTVPGGEIFDLLGCTLSSDGNTITYPEQEGYSATLTRL